MARVSSQAINFEQSAAASKWTLTHNLGCRPHVSVSVNYDGKLQQILPKEIVYVDLNTVEVNFTSAYSGVARVS